MGCDATREGEVVSPFAAREGSRSGPRTCAGAISGRARRSSSPIAASDGATRMEGLKHLDRGYERLDEKLARSPLLDRRREREWSE